MSNRPTSSVLFLSFVPPIVSNNGMGRNQREWLACRLRGFEPEHRALALGDFLTIEAKDRDISLTRGGAR